MYKLVCNFNGTIYSKHRTIENAEKAKKKLINQLKTKINCGTLYSNVQIVDKNARFTNIVPADNEYSCVQVSQKRWV